MERDVDSGVTSLSLKERKLMVLAQKNETRKQRREERRQMKTGEQPPDNENIELVMSKFERLEQQIMSILKRIEQTNGDDNDSLPQLFDACYCKLEEWQNTISLADHILKIYHKKQLRDKYHAFNDKRQKLENELIPQQKFTFKKLSRPKEKLVDDVLAVAKDEWDSKLRPKEDVVGADQSVDTTITAESRKEAGGRRRFNVDQQEELDVRDKQDEILVFDHERMRGKDAVFVNLSGCQVTVEGGANTLHFVALRDCRVTCGPVSTSVLIDECERCFFALACQQLRIHRTRDVDFYVHVTSRSIIEDSERVRFAPYVHHYDRIDEHFDACGLRRTPNNWNVVDDFNWLSSQQSSPHWSLVPESERVSFTPTHPSV